MAFFAFLKFESRGKLETKLGAKSDIKQRGTGNKNTRTAELAFHLSTVFYWKCFLLKLFSMKIFTLYKDNIIMANLIMSAFSNKSNLYTHYSRNYSLKCQY